MNDPILTRAVTRYYTEKAKIKERQKVELETELNELAADVGDEIARVRLEKGASIADIAGIMGVQNRSFIYNMIKASENRGPIKGKAREHEEPEADTEDDGTEPEAPYVIEWFNGGTVAHVIFPDDEQYEIVVIDNVPDLPDEWAEHSRERRVLYKEIAKLLREGDKGDGD